MPKNAFELTTAWSILLARFSSLVSHDFHVVSFFFLFILTLIDKVV